MMTLEEYKRKKDEIDLQVYEILKDDSGENVVYDLHRHVRGEDGYIACCGVFKKYENLEAVMASQIEFVEHANNDDYCEGDYSWFVINKYRLHDGEYKEELSCRIDFDGRLLNYLPFGDVLRGMEIPSSKDVIKPYNTGDILKVKNTPLTEDFYIIYIYDEDREGNKNLQMCFDEEVTFCEIYWLELTEKVDICPDEKINEMSIKIKDNDTKLDKFFKEQKISLESYPF